MNKRCVVRVQWIFEECGGRRVIPFEGPRIQVRWQQHIKAYLECLTDGQVSSVTATENELCSLIELEFGSELMIQEAWLAEGNLVELLEGYRVIGVGKIC